MNVVTHNAASVTNTNDPYYEQLATLLDTVYMARQQLSGLWATPPADDALAFAMTELGEAVDAQLRQNPVYNRNTDRARDYHDELADCAIMLATAAMQLSPSMRPHATLDLVRPSNPTYARIASHIAEAANLTSQAENELATQHIYEALVCVQLAAKPQILSDIAKQRLVRIASRVAPHIILST